MICILCLVNLFPMCVSYLAYLQATIIFVARVSCLQEQNNVIRSRLIRKASTRLHFNLSQLVSLHLHTHTSAFRLHCFHKLQSQIQLTDSISPWERPLLTCYTSHLTRCICEVIRIEISFLTGINNRPHQKMAPLSERWFIR